MTVFHLKSINHCYIKNKYQKRIVVFTNYFWFFLCTTNGSGKRIKESSLLEHKTSSRDDLNEHDCKAFAGYSF